MAVDGTTESGVVAGRRAQHRSRTRPIEATAVVTPAPAPCARSPGPKEEPGRGSPRRGAFSVLLESRAEAPTSPRVTTANRTLRGGRGAAHAAPRPAANWRATSGVPTVVAVRKTARMSQRNRVWRASGTITASSRSRRLDESSILAPRRRDGQRGPVRSAREGMRPAGGRPRPIPEPRADRTRAAASRSPLCGPVRVGGRAAGPETDRCQRAEGD